MIIQRHRQQEQLQVLPEEARSIDPPETGDAKLKMSPVRHRHALTLAAALLFVGHYLVMVGNVGKNSLRGYDEASYQLEKKTNDTIESLMTTLHEKTAKNEELVALVKRLETMEKKLDAPEEHADKHDVATLQKQLSLLDDKIATTKGMAVTKVDLDAFGEKLALFETKLQTHHQADTIKANDLITLKEKVETFEKKIQTHEDKSVTKEDLDLLNDLIASVEKKIPNAEPADETDPETKSIPSKLPADSSVIKAPLGDTTLPEELKQTSSKFPRVIKAPWGEVTLQDAETKEISSELPAESSVIKAPAGDATLVEEAKSTPNKLPKVIKAPWGEVTLPDKSNEISSELPADQGRLSVAVSEDKKMTSSQLPTSEKRTIDIATTGSAKQMTQTSSKLPAANTKVTDAMTPPVKPKFLTEQEYKLLRRFNPKIAPIMGKAPADPNQPARVRMLLLAPKKGAVRVRQGPLGLVRDEMVNIVLDGLKRSPYFEALEPTKLPDHRVEPDFVLREQDDVVWVVDAQTIAAKGSNYSVVEEVLIAAKATVNYQKTLTATRKPLLKIVFVDYYDKIAGKDEMCGPALEELVKLLGIGNVRDVVGKVVVGRHWEQSIGWTEPGTIWNSNHHSCLRAPTLRSAYTVRSDYAEAVERLFPKFLGEGGTKPELPTPVDTIRPVDVWHHWDAEQKPERKTEYRHFSHLRSAVSEVIASLSGLPVRGRNITTKAETVSEGGSIGRTEIGQEYLESLLKSKIVVVTQRDAWEDHYRLFEALAGGAMVMTDTMLSLPDGLVDRESVVMFKSREQLRVLLLYYLHPKQEEIRLAIARKGFEVAMGHHRSYHRMEEVFFGKQLSLPAVPQNSVTASREANGTPPKRPPRKKRTISVANKGNVKQNKGTNS